MIIEDYTLNKKYSELEEGTVFVWYSRYYMKLRFYFYDESSNKEIISYSYAVNLEDGFTTKMKDDEKVRVVDGKMVIG